MKLRRLFIAPAIAGVLLLTVSCSNPFAPTSTTSDSSAASPEVKTAVEEFIAKLNNHSASETGDYLSDDPNFQWVEDGKVVYETRTAAIAGLENFFSGFGESHIDAYNIKIAALSDNAAVATFHYTQTIAANGAASLKVEGAMTVALTDRDGSWKLLAVHKSASGAPR